LLDFDRNERRPAQADVGVHATSARARYRVVELIADREQLQPGQPAGERRAVADAASRSARVPPG